MVRVIKSGNLSKKHKKEVRGRRERLGGKKGDWNLCKISWEEGIIPPTDVLERGEGGG